MVAVPRSGRKNADRPVLATGSFTNTLDFRSGSDQFIGIGMEEKEAQSKISFSGIPSHWSAQRL
jgi:hypothetical protein